MSALLQKVGVANIISWCLIVGGFVTTTIVGREKLAMHLADRIKHTSAEYKTQTEIRLKMIEEAIEEATREKKWLSTPEREMFIRKIIKEMKREGLIK